jgi:hypothetical protein
LDEEASGTDSDDVGKNGELDEGDELTIADIDDLEAEDNEDIYTTSSCRQTLAKVCFNQKFPKLAQLDSI